MFGRTYGIFVIFVVLLNLIRSGLSQSPCPDYFNYLRDEITGDIVGRIVIPGPPKNVPLHLRISLSVATSLPTKYVGRLELASSRTEAVRAVQQGRPLVYRLSFPIRNPIPLLTEIMFNGQRICMGRRAAGPIVTTIFLEHTLYPPGVIALSDNRPSSIPGDFSNIPEILPAVEFSSVPISHRPIEPSHPFMPPSEIDQTFIDRNRPDLPSFATTTPRNPYFIPSSSDNDEQGCGRPYAAGVNFLIANGKRTSPGQWPWLTAIFLAKLEFKFQCAGNLITDKHVITAAHCKFDDNLDVPASTFLVILGRFHLDEWRERGSKSLEVLEFRAHPEYRSRVSADADLAIIVLRDKVQFTPRIQPLCLWSEPINLESIVGRDGYVVGWGRDENGHQYLKEPRMATTPVVSQEDCLRSHTTFVPATSNRTLCAGRRDGSGPCNGDSGSGLVILNPKTGRYHLRGIVSLSLFDTKTMSCDLSQYIVYVDVAKFLPWIKAQTEH